MRVKPDFSERPFGEHPRPQMRRESFFSLNGRWEYAITEDKEPPERYQGEILVPYSPESAASGAGRQLKAGEYLHYRRSFDVPKGFDRGRVFCHFGACDQECEVFLNGVFLGGHAGGYTPFSFELFPLRQRGNELRVRVRDDAASDRFGRGKQSYRPGGIWYTATSGLWQTVWLESTPLSYIRSFRFYPDAKAGKLTVKVLSSDRGETKITVLDGDMPICEGRGEGSVELDVSACRRWTPDAPELYRVVLAFGEDRVESYFGLRDFSLAERDGRRYFALNGEPIFQSGLLDQGYWPEGVYTPPSNRAMYEEIAAVKALGFNMLRKHIKLEPALWYYYCDCLGVLVWQDLVNGGAPYKKHRIYLAPFVDLHIDDTNYRGMGRNEASRAQYLREAEETIDALFNCVSLCLWTPFNEAWGQFDAVRVCERLRAIDPTRLYDHASGWQDKGGGDVCSRHVYFRKVRLKNDKRRALALTEFGGYSFALAGHVFREKRFGYRGFHKREDYVRAWRKLYEEEILPAVEREGLCAAVYTQLSDVEEEINGIFTADRVLKGDGEEMRRVNEALRRAFERSLARS